MLPSHFTFILSTGGEGTTSQNNIAVLSFISACFTLMSLLKLVQRSPVYLHLYPPRSGVQINKSRWIFRQSAEDPHAAVGHCGTGEVREVQVLSSDLLVSSLVYFSLIILFFLLFFLSEWCQVSQFDDGVLQRRDGVPPSV